VRAWDAQNEHEFRLALSVRQERDPDLYGYFFDTSIVYVYVNRYGNPLDFASNLLHELGHSKLADTPLGFLQMSLFEIAALAGEELYHGVIEPILKRHSNRTADFGRRQNELTHLETLGPRNSVVQEASRKEAIELFSRAQSDLTIALSDSNSCNLVSLFRRIQRRRKLISDQARLSHEANATYFQLSTASGAIEKHINVLKKFISTGKIASRNDVEQYVNAKKQSLSGIWQEGFSCADRIAEKTGNPGNVLTAGLIAHHFPYQACDVIDMGDDDFSGWIKSTRLSADIRFRRICEEPDLIANSPLQTLLHGHTIRPLIKLRNNSFTEWHRRYVFESEACKPIASKFRNFDTMDDVKDDWTASILIPRPRPDVPVIFDDGTILTAHKDQEALVKADFVRAEKIDRVLRILARLTQ
jgi:hypothetical protein